MEGRHLERAGEVLYIHGAGKTEVTIVTNTFCTEGVPVRLGHANYTLIRNINAVLNFYGNYTVAECNPVYLNLMKLTYGS